MCNYIGQIVAWCVGRILKNRACRGGVLKIYFLLNDNFNMAQADGTTAAESASGASVQHKTNNAQEQTPAHYCAWKNRRTKYGYL